MVIGVGRHNLPGNKWAQEYRINNNQAGRYGQLCAGQPALGKHQNGITVMNVNNTSNGLVFNTNGSRAQAQRGVAAGVARAGAGGSGVARARACAAGVWRAARRAGVRRVCGGMCGAAGVRSARRSGSVCVRGVCAAAVRVCVRATRHCHLPPFVWQQVCVQQRRRGRTKRKEHAQRASAAVVTRCSA